MSEGDDRGRVGVRELRQNLSIYLSRVKEGESLDVTEHGHVVASLVPAQRDLWDQMVTDGRIALGRGDLAELGPPPAGPPGPSATEDLAGDPRRGSFVTDGAVYVDASALVKLVIAEPETPGLLSFLANAPNQYSSRVSAIEVMRAVDRRGGYDSERLMRVLSEISYREVDEELAFLAAGLAPATLRTLDAIHLASAIQLRRITTAFITYDARLADAASVHGFTVEAPT